MESGMANREIKMIQDALAKEGRFENGQCVVPDDFFERLNAQLNQRQGPSILEQLLQKFEGDH